MYWRRAAAGPAGADRLQLGNKGNGMTESAFSRGTVGDGIEELTVDLSSSPYYSHDMAPVPRSGRRWTYSRHGGALDLDVGLRDDLHARLGHDRRGHELVAGDRHDFPGQRDRAHPDRAQCPCGHEVRHSVSRLLPAVVRHPGCQCSGAAASAGGLRLVWDPNVDRRLGNLQDSHRVCAGLGRIRRRCRWSASMPPKWPASCSSGRSICGSCMPESSRFGCCSTSKRRC